MRRQENRDTLRAGRGVVPRVEGTLASALPGAGPGRSTLSSQAHIQGQARSRTLSPLWAVLR